MLSGRRVAGAVLWLAPATVVGVGLHPLVRRLLSPVGFACVAACFLLPFVTVSCTGRNGAALSSTYSGVDLAVGNRSTLTTNARGRELAGYYGGPSLEESNRRYAQPIHAQPLAGVAVALAVIGLSAAALRRPWYRALVLAGLATSTATFLVGAEVLGRTAARARALADAGPFLGTQPESGYTVHVTIGYGFWLALVLLGVLAVGNIVRLAQLSRPPPVEDALVAAGSTAG